MCLIDSSIPQAPAVERNHMRNEKQRASVSLHFCLKKWLEKNFARRLLRKKRRRMSLVP